MSSCSTTECLWLRFLWTCLRGMPVFLLFELFFKEFCKTIARCRLCRDLWGHHKLLFKDRAEILKSGKLSLKLKMRIFYTFDGSTMEEVACNIFFCVNWIFSYCTIRVSIVICRHYRLYLSFSEIY